MVNLSWVSISQDQKVTPAFVTGFWVQYNKTVKYLGANTYFVNMLETQEYQYFFLSILFNLIFFFKEHSNQELFFYKI